MRVACIGLLLVGLSGTAWAQADDLPDGPYVHTGQRRVVDPRLRDTEDRDLWYQFDNYETHPEHDNRRPTRSHR